jgi:hypothetical protein
MDPTGFFGNLVFHAVDIDIGRKGPAANGEEHAGRIHYGEAIFGSLMSFRKVQTSVGPQVLVCAELIFFQQVFQFYDDADSVTRNSLTRTMQSFEDALRSLVVLGKSACRETGKSIPRP